MALSMNTSSIGVSSSGMKQVRDEIKMNLIDESIKSLNSGCENLIDNVDTYWHGTSANAFKIKVKIDRAKIATILMVLKDKMEIDLGVMATNTAIADAEVATSLYGLAGASHTTPDSGNTPTSHTPIGDRHDLWTDVRAEISNSTPESDNLEALGIDVGGILSVVSDNILPVLGSTGATIATGAISVAEGALHFGESLVDAGAIICSGAGSAITGIIDAGSFAISSFTGGDFHSLTADLWNCTTGFVTNDYVTSAFSDFFNNTSAGQTLSRYSYAFDTVRNGGTSVGYSAGIIASTLTGAAPVSAFLGGLSGLGSGTEAAWQSGATVGQGVLYGAATAVLEGSVAYMGNRITNAGASLMTNLRPPSSLGQTMGYSSLAGLVAGGANVARTGIESMYSGQSFGDLLDQRGGWLGVVENAVTDGLHQMLPGPIINKLPYVQSSAGDLNVPSIDVDGIPKA